MGPFSEYFLYFSGRMNVELSFLIDGDIYKAVLQKEKTFTEEEKTEVITIRLFEQDKSIFLKSYSEDNETPILRW